ncbi:glycosyltransferase family 4 protein [Tranquillimonas rosea]|uniref:glycosyltransferase family 4 protein n=1 Tax=Tranquillimonas rosea TaxID=641238 RepID=UPI003BAA04F7
MSRAVFAIPGDMHRRTGGFIYEARLLRTLNQIGVPTAHLELPAGFPDPTDAEMEATFAALAAVPADTPVILDGFVSGTIDPRGLARISAPLIAMVHHPLGLEAGLPPERAAFLKRNEAAALRHFAHILVPSAETARLLADEFGADPARITVAPPGFDRPVLDPRPAEPPLILSVGLLAPRKGHDVLIEALSRLTDIPWQAEIVGKAHERSTAEDLRHQVAARDLVGRVRFSGELDDNALAARFNAATIFALATRYEGYGMVLSEAMLYGLPIVSCDTGAVPGTVGDAAHLVPRDDPDAFADALRMLLEVPSEAERLAARARCRAAMLPSWTDTARIAARAISSLGPGLP